MMEHYTHKYVTYLHYPFIDKHTTTHNLIMTAPVRYTHTLNGGYTIYIRLHSQHIHKLEMGSLGSNTRLTILNLSTYYKA